MKPKKLNIQEIHRLYLLLKDTLPEQEELYLIDEIEGMVGRMHSGRTLVKAVDIMYPRKELDVHNPLEMLLLFIQGLKENEFFYYAKFINGITSGKRTS